MYGSQRTRSNTSASGSRPSSIESGISAHSAQKRRARRVRRVRRRARASPNVPEKARGVNVLTAMLSKTKISKKPLKKPVKKNMTPKQLANLLSMINIKKK